MATIYASLTSSMIEIIRVDTSGNSQLIKVDKFTIMRRYDLPSRDIKLLDQSLDYPSTIIGREKSIVVNLEQIRCIITTDEVFLLNPRSSEVLQYVVELQKNLQVAEEGGNVSHDYLPFEFKALKVALEAACTFLDSQCAEIEVEAYPALDLLTSKISTLNLERVRQLKSRLVALTRRVQMVRDAIEQLMDDDGNMAEMYLTKKKRRMESSFSVSSPPDSPRPEDKSPSIARSGYESTRGNENATYSIEEIAIMLLAAYFAITARTLDKLTSLKEYIDDTEDYISIQLDSVRNKLIQVDLLLSTASFILSIFGVVAGIFGMNLKISLYESHGAFKWVLIITGVCGAVVLFFFLSYFKYRRLMPLR